MLTHKIFILDSQNASLYNELIENIFFFSSNEKRIAIQLQAYTQAEWSNKKLRFKYIVLQQVVCVSCAKPIGFFFFYLMSGQEPRQEMAIFVAKFIGKYPNLKLC